MKQHKWAKLEALDQNLLAPDPLPISPPTPQQNHSLFYIFGVRRIFQKYNPYQLRINIIMKSKINATNKQESDP